REPVLRDREVIGPGVAGRIEQPCPFSQDRGDRTGPIAESAGVEAVPVVVPSVGIRAPRRPVLDGGSSETFPRLAAIEIGLVKQAKRAGETEIPAQARPVSGPVLRGEGPMPTSCRFAR